MAVYHPAGHTAASEELSMSTHKDVIIIGGGIIGIACAHYLLEKGYSVRIFEKDGIGSGASHGNCGLLHFSGVIPLCAPGTVTHEIIRAISGTSPLYIKPTVNMDRLSWLFKFASFCRSRFFDDACKSKKQILDYSLTLFEQLLSAQQFNCDFEKKGLLMLFKQKDTFEKYSKTNDLLKKFGYGGRRLETEEARRLEPALKPNMAGAWHADHDWHLRPEIFIREWTSHLVKKGLLIDEKNAVQKLDIRNGKITRVICEKGEYTADEVVLASGAWAPQLSAQLNFKLPVQPGKGYSITMETPDGAPKVPCLLYERNMVVTPWKSGYRLGGTMELSGYGTSLNRGRLNKLLDGARQYLTATVDRPVLEEWAGLRPMAADDLPIIGRISGIGNLTLATGHGMLGVTMATGTGRVVSDLISGQKSEIDLSGFNPNRFH